MSTSSVRQRPTSTSKQPSQKEEATTASASAPSASRWAVSQTLTSTANLANLLPTGTLLAFQLLTPLFTNNGVCDSVTRLLTLLLLLLLGLSCFLACFTDSVKASDGKVYHGLATPTGLWVFDYPDGSGTGLPKDLRSYKIRPIDWVHSVLSVLVFSAVALRDKNVVSCFYPRPQHETQEVLDIVPVAMGLLCSLLFVVFPTTRHGIGYPLTPSTSSSS
ncbi:hypothetical protein HN51_003636 [Arachis hypogaea]|uniref:Uncharacterized protein n=1 Tax=Arachis hypogaea TaxID=3818 RepID=A0A445DK97_ARAHY|nr:protein DMP3 [Arachis hypogaea]QHO37148.1 uncharacterized protein DS421_4g109060 [Arachis hypogaea]RYR63598.1 hypothetical protein Ahy_A04g021388 [Arachis hypogaea]